MNTITEYTCTNYALMIKYTKQNGWYWQNNMKNKKNVYCVLTIVYSLLAVGISSAQTWSPVPGYNPKVLVGNKSIRAMSAYNGKLYVAGEFDSIGNLRTPNIASWDNTKWDSAGKSADYRLECLKEYNNKLIATSNLSVNGLGQVISWDNAKWESVGISTSSPRMYSIAVYKNELYVGGQFTEMGGKTVNNIARWNGSTWNDVGGGVVYDIPIVYSMAVYDGSLYVGGCFGKAGNIPVYGIAKWNGTQWDSLSIGGLDGCVGNMLVDTVKNILYITGSFTYVGGVYTDGIAQYDGVNWTAVGNAPVPAGTMCMYHGELYTSGGYTTTYGGETLRYICRWDGTTFHSVGTGMNDVASSMIVYEDDLYIGGYFTEANGNPNIKYLAKWSMPVSVEEFKVESSKFKVYPNPGQGELLVELEENIQGKKMQLCVYDNLGKELLRQTIHQKKETLTISHLAKGIYHAKLIAENNVTLAVKKFVVQ